MVEKASGLDCDMVILDCEDSIPFKEKKQARDSASKAVSQYAWSPKEIGIRINAVDTEFWRDDLISASLAAPDFLVIPKVEEPAEISLVESVIKDNLGDKQSSTQIIVAIESAKGLVNVEHILLSSSLITAIEFGAEDYSLSLGILSIKRSEQSALYARSRVVAAARAFGMDALDQAFVNLNDPEGLRESAIQAKQLGFSGKSVIHPNQIPIVNEVFSPSDDEISWARRVLEGWKEAEQQGKGAFRFEDKMVDIVHVRMAEEILKRSKN